MPAISIHTDAVVGINPYLLLVTIADRKIRDVLPAVDVVPRRLGYATQDPCLK